MNNTRALISLATGLIILAIVLLLVIFTPTPAAIKYFIIRILIALAAGGIAAVIPGYFDIKYKGFISAGGGIGIFTMIYLVNPASLKIEAFSTTVFVHGEKGIHDFVLTNNDSIIIDLRGDRRIEKPDHRGMVTFKEIPAQFLGLSVPISINAEIYQAKKDSFYKLSENAVIYIEVIKKGLSTIRGFVLDENMNPISGATVRINSLLVNTDTLGLFKLDIPENEQKQIQEVVIWKVGYQLWTGPATPETGEEMRAILRAKIKSKR